MGWLFIQVWQGIGRLRWLVLWLIHPKFSLGVNGYIVNEQGQVWLQKHRFWEDQSWGLPGGFMRAGESPEAALAREVYEETGMRIEAIRLLDGEMFFRQGLSLCYAATFTGGTLQLDNREIMEADFFDPDSLPRPITKKHARLLARVRQQAEDLHHESAHKAN